MYAHARHHLLGVMTNLPGKVGRSITSAVYRAVRKVVKFN